MDASTIEKHASTLSHTHTHPHVSLPTSEPYTKLVREEMHLAGLFNFTLFTDLQDPIC